MAADLRGAIFIFAGVIANMHIYFQPTSLIHTIIMLVLLVGGLGLIAARCVQPAARLRSNKVGQTIAFRGLSSLDRARDPDRRHKPIVRPTSGRACPAPAKLHTSIGVRLSRDSARVQTCPRLPEF